MDGSGDYSDILSKASSPSDLAALLIATPVGYLIFAMLGLGIATPATLAILFGSFCLGVKKAVDARLESKRQAALELAAAKTAELQAAPPADQESAEESVDRLLVRLRSLVESDIEIAERHDITSREFPRLAEYFLLVNEVNDQARLLRMGLVTAQATNSWVSGALSVRKSLWRDLLVVAMGRPLALEEAEGEPASLELETAKTLTENEMQARLEQLEAQIAAETAAANGRILSDREPHGGSVEVEGGPQAKPFS
ncbi:hypothetical protein AAII07_01990 [Microvirga sp. 0TCS3.31]